MLLRGEKLSSDWQKLNDDVKAGRYSDAEAVPHFRALDPFDAAATLLEAKFRSLVAPRLGNECAGKLVAACRAAEQLRDIAELLELATPKA